MADHLHQVFGELGFLQHHAHEDEERDREQRGIGDDAEDAARKQIEQKAAEADVTEHEAGGRQREPDRNAGHQQHEERHQHQDGENFQRAHQALRIAIVAFDRLRQRLQEQKREADRDQRLDDVAIFNAAGIGGPLADRPGLIDVRDRQPDHDHAERHREKSGDDIDDVLGARRERREQHVDAHMLAMQQRVGHAEQADRHEDVPFQLLRPDEAEREAVAEQHIRAHDERDAERQPGRDAADEIDECVDPAGQLCSRIQIRPSGSWCGRWSRSDRPRRRIWLCRPCRNRGPSWSPDPSPPPRRESCRSRRATPSRRSRATAAR